LAKTRNIPVGVLFSASGTMALNETSLRDVILMEVERINAAGGLLGQKLEPVVLDPGSEWPAYAEMAQALIQKHRVAAIFGCWTSAARQCVVPVVERANNLLFYPMQYEGEEQSPNVFYLGATPNQQAIPALEYLMSAAGGAFGRFFFIGTDYIYPRTTNRILRAFLQAKGVPLNQSPECYVSFTHHDWQEQIAALKRFYAGGRGAVISTINGDSNLSFYKALRQAGLTAQDLPIMAFSVSEAELQRLEPDDIAGHYAAWDYFMSDPAPENTAFLATWRRFDPTGRPVYAPMEAAVLGLRLWCKAVTTAGTTQTGPVRQYMLGQTELALNGQTVTMGVNHHVEKTVSVGRATRDRQFQIIWSAPRPIAGDPWAADNIIADARAANAQRDVLDALPSPLMVFDEQGNVCYSSASATAYFGATISPGILQQLREILSKSGPAAEARVSRLPEITAHDASGGALRMTVAASRMVFAGQPAHLLSLSDVTYIRNIEDQLRARNRQLHELAITDPLTGVNNRRHFVTAVGAGLKQMHRLTLPSAMFLLDLDHFKGLNDRYGHEFGDHVLVEVAAAARRMMRKNDVFARVGGEEFAGFLPETDIGDGVVIVERLRKAVGQVQLHAGDDKVGVTCSIGIALVDPQADTPETAMNRADQALYAAKRQGRDRVHWQ
jgi:urea transport system substrate-binding protein